MSGKIVIEVLGSERYNHNLELALGKDPVQIKSKLRQVYDPALCALTAEPELSYESGLIKIRAPIAAEQDAGPYMIRVEASAPNRLSGFLRVQPFEGVVIRIKKGLARGTFTVRKVSYGIGVERIFPIHSPNLVKIDIRKRAKVKRSRIYYLRERYGKAARLKEVRQNQPGKK